MVHEQHAASKSPGVDMPLTPPASAPPTYPPSSRSDSPRGFDEGPDADADAEEPPDAFHTQKKKKKKKRAKKPKADGTASSSPKESEAEKPPAILCISRNKHWRYISSYHGPWLQLPLELLESLLMLNMDPTTFTMPLPDGRPPPVSSSRSSPSASRSVAAEKRRGFPSFDLSPPPSPPAPLPGSLPPLQNNTGKPTPPPIDPGVFRSVTAIRRLIDEASDLAVRAASGLSAAALGSIRSPIPPAGMNSNPRATAQSLGISSLGEQGSGRNTAMSAMRVHRLRALAVQKLAAAYKADEIAASVMVMQGASALDDIAERVLKVDPNDPDARYVHFFHEKIPSRQLAESTTTRVLDELITENPQRLEFYRTRGIVHCFRDEYSQAIRDFTHALKEARNVRKAKQAHNVASEIDRGLRVKGKKGKKTKVHGQAPPDGTAVPQGDDDYLLTPHPSVLPDAPEPLEPQLLFLRGAAYLQNVVFLIEEAILELEGVNKTISSDGGEMRLCYIESGKYGGVEIGNPSGPLGAGDGPKAQAYRARLSDASFRERINLLLRKSIRDHERFLSHFDTLDTSVPIFSGNLAQRTEYAFLLSEALRPGSLSRAPPSNAPLLFTTYHPLLVESHFSILLANLMLGDFVNLLPTFARTAALVDGLEGYPVFLPARSMAQAEFIEVLERLAGDWSCGVQPHTLSAEVLRIRSGSVESGPSSEPGGSVVGNRTWDDRNGRSRSASESGRTSPESGGSRAVDNLDCARMLLGPVARRQREKMEKAALEKTFSVERKRGVPINIPLHGPRVEIVLAWLGSVHLPEMERVA